MGGAVNLTNLLLRLRPSNLIILFALPFICWLFFTAPNYSRSLAAIVGVEPGATRLVPGFLLTSLFYASGCYAAVLARSGNKAKPLIALVLSLVAGLLLGLTGSGLPFLNSVVANSVDPFTSSIVVPGETPRRLTDASALSVAEISGWLFSGLALLTAACLWFALFIAKGLVARRICNLVVAFHGTGIAWLVLFAHVGFAVGLVVTLRAAMTAYGLAVVMALLWVGLLQLQYKWRSCLTLAAFAVALALGAVWQLSSAKLPYVLVGSATGKVGIVQNTPKSLVDSVRFGAFPDAPSDAVDVRTFATVAEGLAAIEKGEVTGTLLPVADAPPGLPKVWETTVLPPSRAATGTALLVATVALGLLVGCGWLHRRHPLSIGAEFIVDTLRGIPMLVIILYIGLPLAGIVKSASGGFIDPPNMLRGIVAMAIAYSAYMAEIFRAGINAVPPGQVEAARSLGLSRWSTARHVVLPQAFRIIIPPMGNEFIAILKDTSLLSILSIRDVTQRMREFQSASFLPFAPYNTAAIVYVLLTLVAASLVARVEHRFRTHHR